jgi:glycosyltransferase involved in cell wall biosynthesis
VSVSLVIPTFNHARLLGEAIDSALAQTLGGVDVVVVDDGSTDDTPAVLTRYAGRIRVLRQSNRGLAAARNAGLAAARGTYVAFLDADDVVAPAKLAVQVAALERAPTVGWTYCDVLIETAATGATVTASERFGYAARALDGWLFPELIHGNFIPAIAPLIRRTALEAAGGFDERLTALEDWDLWLRLALIAEARYTPEVLVRYRIHPGGLSEDRARMDRNRFHVLDKLGRTRPAAVESLGSVGRRIIADTHNWLGKEAYAAGDWSEARRRFAMSVLTVPWQRQAPWLLGLSLVRDGVQALTSGGTRGGARGARGRSRETHGRTRGARDPR